MASRPTADELAIVVSVLTDRTRIDRYLRRADDDGHLYTTPKTFLTSNGPITPPYVTIPVADTDTDPALYGDALDQWAESLIEELDDQDDQP